MDKEEKLQQAALFRYSLIAPVVAGTFEAPSIAQYFRNVAAMEHKHPDGRRVTVTSHSLERWLYNYKKHGLLGITPKKRADIGLSRALTAEAVERIPELKKQFPYITGKAIYKKLIEEGAVNASELSLSTVHRYLKNNGLKSASRNAREVKSFEMEFANDCWQTDTSRGPVVKISGKKSQTHLIALIDDASRMILHAQLYLNDNAVNMQDSFRKGIAKFGVPKMLYCDNGGTYNNLQLELICASLGIVLAHSRPYEAKSRGKIERHFRTIKDGWMNCTDWNLFSSLEEADESLSAFLSKEYTNENHSSIHMTPKERFLRDYDKIRRVPTEELDFHFLHRRECRVYNDAIVKLGGAQYEVPQKFIGSKVKVRYLPGNMSELFIYSDENKILHTLRPVKKIENSKVKRASIDYSNMEGES